MYMQGVVMVFRIEFLEVPLSLIIPEFKNFRTSGLCAFVVILLDFRSFAASFEFKLGESVGHACNIIGNCEVQSVLFDPGFCESPHQGGIFGLSGEQLFHFFNRSVVHVGHVGVKINVMV